MQSVARLIGGAVLVSAGLVGLGGTAGAQVYPPTGCALVLSTSTVVPGQTITASTTNGPCYAPGASVALAFTSAPVSLGTVTADANGQFSTRVRIPSNATLGHHTISSRGLGADGSTLVLSASVTVVAPGALAKTGASGTVPTVWIALVALVTGTALVVASRRRATIRARDGRSL